MSDKKPGLFRRLKNSISSTLSEAVESLSDPGQEVALMLDDLASQIQHSEKDLRQAMVDRKVMERKVEELAKEESSWQKKAEQALKLGDEELAKAALRRKSEATTRLTDTRSALIEQQALVDRMSVAVRESKSRLQALNLRRGSLMAQARAAKKGVSRDGIGDGGPSSRIDTIESRIAELEAFNEVHQELNREADEAAGVDARLSELAGNNDLDDALAQLKAKLQADQKSIGASKDEDS